MWTYATFRPDSLLQAFDGPERQHPSTTPRTEPIVPLVTFTATVVDFLVERTIAQEAPNHGILLVWRLLWCDFVELDDDCIDGERD